MNYTVVWIPEAEQELLNLWLEEENRQAVTEAVDFLDAELANDPLNIGESRPTEFLRIAHALPIGIKYEVKTDDQLVRVLAVWLCRRLNRNE